MSLTVTLLCPHCAGEVDMHSTDTGVCTRCRADLTVTVTETWSRVQIDRGAPFFPLVQLIDSLPDVDVRRGADGKRQSRAAWRIHRASTSESDTNSAYPRASTGTSEDAAETMV